MKKTTLYLPDELKKKIEKAAKEEDKPEASVIRDALDSALEARQPPRPRIPLPGVRLGDPTIAERAGDLMDGFGK